ncbi:MAG: amidohydrolase [Thermodesulfobacteriota bacterium]
MHCDLLVKNGLILPRPGQEESVDSGFVAIAAGEITAVGQMADLGAITAEATIDASGCLVMPGLVNGHVHGAMTLFRGLADDLPLQQWLMEHIFPAEAAHVNEEMVYWATRLAAAEMLLGGVTTVADAYFCVDGAARAYSEAGMRAVVAHGVIDFPAPGVPDPADKLTVVRQFCRRWQDHPLVTPAVFAHSPYTCGPETLRDSRQLARELGVDFFIHLAETKGEADLLPAEAGGKSPTAYLDELAVLDEGVVVVHGVWLSPADMEILAHRGCRLVSCPGSNMKLASGAADLAGLRERGIPLGLGTDGCASNNNLDMFGEMGSAARLAKVVALDPELMPAHQVLEMATVGGARVLGQAGQGLAVGGVADLIVIDLKQPHLTPFYNSDILVYGARAADVRDVVVAGRRLVAGGRLLAPDLEQVMARVREMAGEVSS